MLNFGKKWSGIDTDNLANEDDDVADIQNRNLQDICSCSDHECL